jgi:selenocysteine-specific elongation factor
VCAIHGDRAVLRDGSGQRTVAGAFVLDAHPPTRGRRTVRRLAALAARDRESPAEIFGALLDCSPTGVDIAAFARNLNLTHEEADALYRIVPLRRTGAQPPVAFSVGQWSTLRDRCLEALAQEHRDVPDALGLNVEQLRLRTAPGIARGTFTELVVELVNDGLLARDGSWLYLPGHQVTLEPGEERVWHAIRPLLLASPFQPPRVRDIAKILALEEPAVRKWLMQAARTGRAYRVAHDHYFERGAVVDLAAIVRRLAAESAEGAVLAAEFRTRIGSGRKLAIHILEFFNRVGLTRRVRDEHRLRNETLSF